LDGGGTNVHGGSNFKGSHGAYFGKISGLACLERKETSSWPDEHAL